MAVFKLLSLLPLGILYLLSDFLRLFAFYILKYRRQVVFENLQKSFPEKSDREIRKIAKGFYKNLSDIIVEAIKGIRISRENLLRRVKFSNQEILDEYSKNDQPVLMVTIHQCNWEWLLLAGCARFPFPIDAVYMPLSNKRFDKLMLETRSRFGGNPIEVKDTVIEIMKRKKSGARAFAMVADQVPEKKAEKYWTNFLNQETPFLMGPEHLPKFTKFPVIFMSMERIKRGHYHVTMEKLAEPPYPKDQISIVPKFVARAEEVIRKNPSDWLWSHRRWKYKKPVYDS